MDIFPDTTPDRFIPREEDRDDLGTPALAIHGPTVRANIVRILDAVGDPACWRPHLKTTKLPEIWSMLIDAGIDRFKCATTREMETLLSITPDVDVLLAHNPSPAALKRVGELAASHPAARLSVLVEDEQGAAELPEGVGAFIDINSGMNRTGIPIGQQERIMMVALACGERMRGIHFYDGHIRDGSEDVRRDRAHAGYDELLQIDAILNGVDEIITSGTTTFVHALSHARLVATLRHSVSPGTVVFHDALSQRMPEISRLELEPAAAVLAHVVSRPTEEIFTLNAGNKSIASDAGDPCCVVLGHPRYIPLHPSEEHLPMRSLDKELPERGELLVLIPEHICPTVNLARYALLLEEGRTTVTRVVAAGHDAPLPTATV